MSSWLRRPGRLKKWLAVLTLLTVVMVVSGCQTLSFYAQAIKGQYELVAHQQSIPKLIAEAQTPEKLKKRLELLQQLRQFAARRLKLPVDGHYEKYVDVHRPFVVWNVEAAPRFSMQPKTWWYPFVGSLKYRGYFSKRGAMDYAGTLRKRGWDVFVGGVPAYSTLGWFKDPVLSTFIFESEPDLAETLFHELAHQRVFARGDTDFNEAYATTVGEEGAQRWLRATHQSALLAEYLAELHRNDQFVRLVQTTRLQLEALYGDERAANGKIKATSKMSHVPRAKLLEGKEEIFVRMREQYAELKEEWGGNTDYDGWFARGLNNAKLNSVAAYYDLVPAFQRLLALNRGDMPKFYNAVERLSKMPRKQRHQWLRDLEPEKEAVTPMAGG
jgi:predicted aminopeptidase